MKILLLGAGGQLGSEWNVFLQNKGDAVDFKSYRSDELDITDAEGVKKTFLSQNPDTVINCAAYTDVDKAEEERDRAKMVNTDAVVNLAEQCKNHSCKLVHYSTDYIFAGDKKDRERYPSGYAEDTETNPLNWYGQTKWEGEQAIRASGCAHLIIRVSWLCGKFGNNFVKTMLRLAEERAVLSVVNDQWGSPAFASNVAKNSLNLLKQKEEGTFHLSSNGLISWYEFARTIFKLADKKVEVQAVSSEEFAAKAKRPYFSKLDTRKISGIPGVELIDWREGLKRLLIELSEQ